MRISDWSSDVCSSDLPEQHDHHQRQRPCCKTDQGCHCRHVASPPSCWTPILAAGCDRYRARGVPQCVSRFIACSRPDSVIGNMRSAPSNSLVTWIDGVRSEEHTTELQSLMRISYAV